MDIEVFRCQGFPGQKSEGFLSEGNSPVHLKKNNVALLLRQVHKLNGFQRDENFLLFFTVMDGYITQNIPPMTLQKRQYASNFSSVVN